MKKINRILFGLLMVAFVSCNTDNEGTTYSTAGVDEATLIGFPLKTQSIVLLPTDTECTVDVFRATTVGEINVSLTVEETSGLFEIPSSVSFADGEGRGQLKIKLDPAVVLGKSYPVVLTVNGAEDGMTIYAKLDLSIMKDYTWKTVGKGKYTSGLFDESWEQEYQIAEENSNMYRLPDCIFKGYPLVFTLSEDRQTLVKWDIQPMGYVHSTYGMVYFLPKAMVKDGNSLIFDMQGLVWYGGRYQMLYNYPETFTFPEE